MSPNSGYAYVTYVRAFGHQAQRKYAGEKSGQSFTQRNFCPDKFQATFTLCEFTLVNCKNI